MTCISIREGGGRVYEGSDIKKKLLKILWKALVKDGITAQLWKYGEVYIGNWLDAFHVQPGSDRKDSAWRMDIGNYCHSLERKRRQWLEITEEFICWVYLARCTYNKIPVERGQEIIKVKISEEWCGLRTETACVDQLITITEKRSAKERKVYPAFIDLQ